MDSSNKGNHQLPILSPSDTPQQSTVKSTRWPWRAISLTIVHLLILAHAVHFFVSGRTLSPVEPSELMYTLESGYLNAGAIFFLAAISLTAIFGRFFCGWGCHIIALQDLSAYLLRRLGIRLKPLRSRLLALIPFVAAFYMFAWPTVYRLWIGAPHPGFTNHLMTNQFWKTFPGPMVGMITFFVCGAATVYLLGNKGFCTYACPYGAFFRISDLVAPFRIRVTDACQHCGQCTAACTSNVNVAAEVKQFGMVVDSGCMKCMDCVNACPNDALFYGIGTGVESKAAKSTRTTNYDFSWSEDIIGLIVTVLTIYALRGLYESVPFLLSIALGVGTAFLVILSSRLISRRDLRLQNFKLKQAQRFTFTGWLIAFLMLIWFVFVGHSLFVQHHSYMGQSILRRLSFQNQQQLFTIGPPEFSESEIRQIELAKRHFDLSDHFALRDQYQVKVGLATTSMLQRDIKETERHLRDAHSIKPWLLEELWLEFLAAQGRFEDP